MGLRRGTSYSLTRTYNKPTNKLVNSHSGALLVLGQAMGNPKLTWLTTAWTRGSHHLPPYSILCASPLHLHPNGTFSQDSQSGVPKLSWFGLSRLWAFITFCSNLRLGQGLKQTCSSTWEFFNGMLHSTCTHRDRVDSWLLVVGSQIANLTPDPSFDHNLCYICPNGSCKAILDI